MTISPSSIFQCGLSDWWLTMTPSPTRASLGRNPDAQHAVELIEQFDVPPGTALCQRGDEGPQQRAQPLESRDHA